MKYDVTLVKSQTCVVKTEAGSQCEAIKNVARSAQLGHLYQLTWKDGEIYGKDAEEIYDD